MKISSYFLVLMLCLITLNVLAATPLTIKEFETPALRMTIGDLDQILNPVRELIAKANENTQNSYISENITLSHDGDSVRLESWSLLSDESSVPKYINSVRYRYSAERNSPIVTLTIILQKSSRMISIEGTDKSQIESISAFLEKQLSRHSNFLSSGFFKLIGAIVLMLVGIVMAYIRKGENDLVWPLNLAGLFVLLSPLVLPWDQWLPEVAIFTGSSSYIDRYINYISVFGTLVSVVGIIITIAKSNKTIQPTPKSDAADG